MIKPLRRQPLVEQTAAHLRDGLIGGQWNSYLPGVIQLSKELMVSKHVIRGALRILEEEGRIEYGGAGKRRKITTNYLSVRGERSLRVAVMLHDTLERENAHNCRILLELREAIESSGHSCVFVQDNITKIGSNISRISRLAKQTRADAWILFQAAANVIEWFLAHRYPTFALGGRYAGLPVASSASNNWPAIHQVVEMLAKNGHRRIVWIIPSFFRKPELGPTCVKFLALLKELGLPASAYNLPDYESTADGMMKLMDDLFRITPPTAMMFLDQGEFVAAFLYLTRMGLEIPRDVSLLCMTSDPILNLIRPRIARFDWPEKEHVRRILRWVQSLVVGKSDLKQITFDTQLWVGDSIGPVKR